MNATPPFFAASLFGGMSLLLSAPALADTQPQVVETLPLVAQTDRPVTLSAALASDGDASVEKEALSEKGVLSEKDALSEKDWWGATLEISTVLVLGELLYKTGSQAMEDDFDYEIDGNAAEFFYDRLTTGASWKYDDNDIGMNWGHAYAGALYYQAFRNHGFNYYESTLGTFAASTIWEVFAEYKEVVSINDQIVTTWGGAVLGESLFQFSEMLAAKEGWLPTGLSYLFNPSRTLRGGGGYPSPNRFDRSQTQDSFSVYTGVRYASKDKAEVSSTMAMLGMRVAIDSREGKYDTLSGTPSRVEMMMETAVSQEGVEEWQMATQLLLASYGRKHKGGGLASDWSHSFYVGPSTGMEYTSLGLEQDEDFYAVVNLLGLSMGANWSNQDISIDLRGDLFGDFAMVKPFATKDYLSQGRYFWGTKSVLWEGEYGYAWGHTFNLSLEASYRNLLLGMKLKSQRWSSINDKENERAPQWNPNNSDLDFDDARDRYEIYLSYGISKDLTLSLHHERIDRSGEIHGIDNPGIYSRLDDSEQRSWLQLEYYY
ncbi:DUF3943 domain-containing protein [Shewanella aegiceratis]|uniref:DUF3943 domain-containing protein n=1 Tax=Shewanella aegiceratis TaxID=2864203 RepID=UPI001C65820D|nr:DUF3943 domain-containing protein [Shewanella aegiceratis]QYJ83558.1 DUF3943 domain-containing protein [Shewanella aegiceratis]